MDITVLLVQSFLLAIGLAMDAFAVSITDGLSMKKVMLRYALLTAGSFGLFQAVMPVLGYLLGNGFADFVNTWDHYIALIFLGFIGGKMIVEAIGDLKAENDEPIPYKFSFPQLIMKAIATSIDALAVGVSFAALSVNIVEASSIIALTTALCCVVALIIGRRFGTMLGDRASMVGGIVLILIGLKSLFS